MAFNYNTVPETRGICPECKGKGEVQNIWNGLYNRCDCCGGAGYIVLETPSKLEGEFIDPAAPAEFKPDTLSTTLPKRLRDW